MFNNKHENYFVYKIYSHWCLYTCMLYRSCFMHLFVYIPTNVTWFSDVNIDTKTIIYPPFCSFLRIFVNRCCLVYQQPNLNARFFWLHFVVVFFFHLRFSHTNCFMLAHCLSLSCSNFNFSRLFFLRYLYFMHTKVVQRSI